MEKYGLTFPDGIEFVHRLDIFANKDDEITLHNAGNFTFTLGHNAFSHLTWEEFQAYFHLGLPMVPRPKGTSTHMPSVGNPTSIDWTAAGKVTPVKNQGDDYLVLDFTIPV